VRTPFPDCLARNAESGEVIRIEFELYGHHFIQHCHDPNDCDMMICWIDDWGQWPDNLRVIAMSYAPNGPLMIEHISDRGAADDVAERFPLSKNAARMVCLKIT